MVAVVVADRCSRLVRRVGVISRACSAAPRPALPGVYTTVASGHDELVLRLNGRLALAQARQPAHDAAAVEARQQHHDGNQNEDAQDGKHDD